MKRIASLCALLCAAACSPKERTPVDMSFRVVVETLENSCDGTEAPEGATAVIDVIANGDDSVTFVSRSALIPGEGTYRGLIVKEDRVDTRFDVEAVGHTFRHEFKGWLTMESMSLTLRVAKRKPGDGAFVECHEKVHLKGKPRPLWNPSSLDGQYLVTMENYLEVCPGDTPTVRGQWNAPLDVDPYREGRAILSVDEEETKVLFDVELGENGSVDWSGPMYVIYGNGSGVELESGITGTLTSGHTDLHVVYRDPGSMGCPYAVGISGGKVAPDPDALENGYRVHYTVEEDCDPIVNGVQGEAKDYDLAVRAVLQDDGSMHLLEDPWRLKMPLEGNSFDQQFFYNWGEAIITYQGSFNPPYLDYTVDWHFWPGQEEYECHHRITGQGHVRYWLEGKVESSTSQALGVRPEAFSGIIGQSGWPGLELRQTAPSLIRLD